MSMVLFLNPLHWRRPDVAWASSSKQIRPITNTVYLVIFGSRIMPQILAIDPSNIWDIIFEIKPGGQFFFIMIKALFYEIYQQ